jgi:preprotein translocase subunit Sec63
VSAISYNNCPTGIIVRLGSLTDETIRKNWELYGHPDGRQEVSMGIALPSWIIEGKNNVWVLGVYALVFGGALPLMVVRSCLFLPSRIWLLVLRVEYRAIGGSVIGKKQKTVSMRDRLQLSSSP